jgi:integrase
MFFVQIDGIKYPLGVTDPDDTAGADEAHRKLLQRLANPSVGPAMGVCLAEPTVAEAVERFLVGADRRALLGKIERHSARNYRTALEALAEAFGPRLLASLTAEEIELWAARPHWSSSYQHSTLGTVASLLRANKVMLNPPLVRPPKESRGAETCLTDEQFEQVLANVYCSRSRGDLVPLLKLLRATGARPGEVAGLTVEGIDWPNAVQVLVKHKNKKRTGKNRPLIFTEEALSILEGQRAQYGSGLLFRTRGGRKAYGPNVIVKQLLKVSKRVGFRVIAYGLGRHSWCTRALVAGESQTVVAALMGTSVKMVELHYSHVAEDVRVMRAAAERVSRGKAG